MAALKREMAAPSSESKRPEITLSASGGTSSGGGVDEHGIALQSLEKRGDPQSPADTAITDEEEDLRILRELGYKQELYRGFSGSMGLAFCFTAVSVLSSVCLLFGYGLAVGGPVVMIWGWVIGSFFTCIAGLSLAEIASAYPSAGAVYTWAGMLADEEWAPFVSFYTGWINFIGNLAGDASFASGFGYFVTAAHDWNISNQDEQWGNGISVLLGLGALVVWAILNALRVDRMGFINVFAIWYQMIAVFIIIFTLLSANTGGESASFVFTRWNNDTGFDSAIYVVLLGLLTTLFAFSGYEAGAHMAEETRGAVVAAPKSIVHTCYLIAFAGLALELSLLFAMKDMEVVLEADNAAIAVFFDVSQSAGYWLTSILAVNTFMAGISSMSVTSRIAFAMARDGAFPRSPWLAHVHSSTMTPLRTVMLVFAGNVVILLLSLGSQLAFAAITSVTVIGFQISYAIPILLRVTVAKDRFVQSQYNLGKWSVPAGWVSGIFLLSTSIIFFFPTTSPVTTSNMNWAIVVGAGFAMVATTYWWTSARKHFQGPRRRGKAVGQVAN